MLRGKPGPLSAVALTVCLSAAVTLSAVLVPTVHLAYREPSVRVALETATALIGLLVAFLVYGRARRSRRPDELVLALGLLWLAASNLLLAAIVSFIPTLNGLRPAVFAGSVVGACLLATAAVVPAHALSPLRLGRFIPVLAMAVTVPLTMLLSRQSGRFTAPVDAVGPHPSTNPWMLAVQAVSMVA